MGWQNTGPKKKAKSSLASALSAWSSMWRPVFPKALCPSRQITTLPAMHLLLLITTWLWVEVPLDLEPISAARSRTPAGGNGYYGLRPLTGRFPCEGIAPTVHRQMIWFVVRLLVTHMSRLELIMRSLLQTKPWKRIPWWLNCWIIFWKRVNCKRQWEDSVWIHD